MADRIKQLEKKLKAGKGKVLNVPIVTRKYEEAYPWERLANEPEDEYKAFKCYRDLRFKRDLRKVSRRMNISLPLLFEMYKDNYWPSRVRQFDIFEEREYRIDNREKIRAMHEKHVKSANIALAASMNTLKKYVPTPDNPDPPKLEDKDAIRLLDIAVKIERLALGVPDSIQETIGEIKVSPQEDKRKDILKILQSEEATEHMAAISKLVGTADDDNSEDL